MKVGHDTLLPGFLIALFLLVSIYSRNDAGNSLTVLGYFSCWKLARKPYNLVFLRIIVETLDL